MTRTLPNSPDDPDAQRDSQIVWHWYDLICPFCYVGQDRSDLLEREGFKVVELGFEIHPETPETGRFVGPRRGAMYERIEQEAKRAGLPLSWPDRIANSRRALSAVEWARQAYPERARELRAALFRAHFASHENISDESTILRHARSAEVPVAELAAALEDGRAGALLDLSERHGRRVGVDSTPSWLVSGRLVSGLVPREEIGALSRPQPRDLV